MIVSDVPNGIAAKNVIKGTNISTISIRRLVFATNAVKYYTAIGRTANLDNMHYVNVLGEFRTDYDAYVLLNKQSSPEVPLVSDKYTEKKIIKWVPLFEDAFSRIFRSNGPLVYIVRENSEVPDVEDYPLTANVYYVASGSMLGELINCLSRAGPIFCNDNKTVFIIISKAVDGMSVDLTIKFYPRRKYGLAEFLALRVNHAGDTKYQSIVKSRSNLTHHIKWNVRNYPLEQYVSNHRTAIDNLRGFDTHIGNAVSDTSHRLKLLLESITFQYNSLQAAMGNICADTYGLRSNLKELQDN